MRMRLMLSLVCLTLGSSFSTAQDSNRWLRLGQRDLDPRGERVVVPINQRATLEALVLGVDNAAVRILDAKIQLGNGQVLNWPIRGVLYPGQRTHVFQLPGRSERRIRSIVLYYETGTRGRRPRGDRFRSLDRDPGPQENAPDWNRDYDRNWDGDWDRHYGRLKPRLSVWGRD